MFARSSVLDLEGPPHCVPSAISVGKQWILGRYTLTDIPTGRPPLHHGVPPGKLAHGVQIHHLHTLHAGPGPPGGALTLKKAEMWEESVPKSPPPPCGGIRSLIIAQSRDLGPVVSLGARPQAPRLGDLWGEGQQCRERP
jgi:hypothetical protein